MLRVDKSTSHSWFVWIAMIGLPPIVLSIAAAVQYRWGHSTGAGAAAVALYWVFLIVFNVRAADLFFFGALFQTVAWFVSRPRSKRTRPVPTAVAPSAVPKTTDDAYL